jgi:hypothetical protein
LPPCAASPTSAPSGRSSGIARSRGVSSPRFSSPHVRAARR